MTLADVEFSYDVLVVGAGAAGIGVAVALQHAGVENFAVFESDLIGASFSRWPAETRFITPSFPTNSIGMLDLNSVAIGVSPGFSLGIEHPTGQDYAQHLRNVAEYFALPIVERIEVSRVSALGDGYVVETSAGKGFARHLIWAAGEFQYPKRFGFAGSELCRHTGTIDSYAELEGDDFVIIGGYESGVDAAFHLAQNGRRVRLFDSGSPWESVSSDPSVSLSPFTFERMLDEKFTEQVELFGNTPVVSVVYEDDVYEVTALDETVYRTSIPPLWAGGFEGSHMRIANLFEPRSDGFPLLTQNDESTIAPGIFFCGPAVRHDNQVFCFIYKYRQRYAVVAKAIANSLGLPAEQLETYRAWGMYLDDLSCCGEECVC